MSQPEDEGGRIAWEEPSVPYIPRTRLTTSMAGEAMLAAFLQSGMKRPRPSDSHDLQSSLYSFAAPTGGEPASYAAGDAAGGRHGVDAVGGGSGRSDLVGLGDAELQNALAIIHRLRTVFSERTQNTPSTSLSPGAHGGSTSAGGDAAALAVSPQNNSADMGIFADLAGAGSAQSPRREQSINELVSEALGAAEARVLSSMSPDAQGRAQLSSPQSSAGAAFGGAAGGCTGFEPQRLQKAASPHPVHHAAPPSATPLGEGSAHFAQAANFGMHTTVGRLADGIVKAATAGASAMSSSPRVRPRIEGVPGNAPHRASSASFDLDNDAVAALMDSIEATLGERERAEASAPARAPNRAPRAADDDAALNALLDSVEAEQAECNEKSATTSNAPQIDVDASEWAEFDAPSPAAPVLVVAQSLSAAAIISRLGALGDPDSPSTPGATSYGSGFHRVPMFLRAVVTGVSAKHTVKDTVGACGSTDQVAVIAWYLETSSTASTRAEDRLCPVVILLRAAWLQSTPDLSPGDIIHVVAVRGGRVQVWTRSGGSDGGGGGTGVVHDDSLRWATLIGDTATQTAASDVAPFLASWLSPAAKASPFQRIVLVDSHQHAIVLHPDLLISPSRIAEGNTCLRRAVLQETLGSAGGSDDSAEVPLLGTLKHELFEKALRVSAGTAPSVIDLLPTLRSAADDILRAPSSVEALYAIGQNAGGSADSSLDADARAKQEMLGVITGVQDWMRSYVPPRITRGTLTASVASPIAPAVDKSVDDLSDFNWDDFDAAPSSTAAPPPFRILQVVGVEESVHSPVWGIKGICDATVDVEFPSPDVSPAARVKRSRRLPLELKTGRRPRGGGAFDEHRAQMLIYALILPERYGSEVPPSVVDGVEVAPAAVSGACNSAQAGAAGDGGPRLFNADVSDCLDGASPVAGLLVYLSSADEQAKVVARTASGQRWATAHAAPDDIALHYTMTINSQWPLQSALLVNRNFLAAALVRAKRQAATGAATPALPPVIRDDRVCSRCFLFAACSTVHACQESTEAGDIEDIGGISGSNIAGSAAALFAAHRRGISEKYAAYYAKWVRLINMEADEQSRSVLRGGSRSRLTNEPRDGAAENTVGDVVDDAPLDIPATAGYSAIWRKSSAQSFTDGTCIPHVRLRAQTAVSGAQPEEEAPLFANTSVESRPAPKGSGADSHEYTFEAGPDAPSLTTLPFSVGDFVVASGDGPRGPFCLLSGVISGLTSTRVLVRGWRDAAAAFPAAFSPPLSGGAVDEGAPFLWRLDRGDVAQLNRAVHDNLVRLVGGRTISLMDDGDSVSWGARAAAAANGTESVQLPGGGGRGDLKRLALLVDLVAPRFFKTPELPWVTDDDSIGSAATFGLTSRAPSAFPRALPSSTLSLELSAEFANVLNEDQRAAVSCALSMRDYACILGMPGTGKTATLAFLIHCFTALGRSVLVTSHTHNAVDNVLLKCLERGMDVLRVGRASAVHKDIAKHCLETLVAQGGATTLHNLHARLQRAQVVGVTCLGIRHALFARRTFDVCIVDEASQIPEPVVIGPLRTARTFLLVGDHMQLPPLVVSSAAKAGGLDVSLFKRLSVEHPAAVKSLTLQYRMNEDIMSLSNQLMYKGALRCGSTAVAEGAITTLALGAVGAPPWLERVLRPETRVIFLDTDSSESTGKPTGAGAPALEMRTTEGDDGVVENRAEADIVTDVIVALLESSVDARDIGVISPLRSQLRLVRRCLKARGDARTDGVEVDTVDRFQGRDKRVIVLSFVRSNSDGQLGQVLSDVRRLNVAVSRAKHKLVLVGSATTLATGSPELKELLSLVQSRGWLCALPYREK